METKRISSFDLIMATVVLINISGCATIAKGSSQSITVNTDPAGAICTVSREGNTLAMINPTPGTITVEKDKDTIAVLCKKEGFQDNTGVLASEFQAMTLGNIIFGGVVGVLIDAGSGAMNQYPPMVTITLVPTEFDSLVRRDAFFDKLKANFEVESATAIERIKKTCTEDTCDSQVKTAEAGRESRLAEIEKKRHLAKVKGK